jgi:transposase-like protein
MSGFFDSQDFELTCPRCNQTIQTRISNLKRADFKCPHCGANYETSNFKRGMDDADHQIDEFKRRLGKIKIDIKI